MNQHSVFRTFLDDLRPEPGADGEETEAARRTEAEAQCARVLAATADPTLLAVLNLHRPVIENAWPVCLGCDSLEGQDAEPPEWPCRTWTLIQQKVAPRP